MNNNLRDEVNRLHAHVCSGLADPIRILILYSLADHTHNVSELASDLGLPQSTISRHLKVLRERNIVTSTRDAQTVWYNIADDRIIEALELLRSFLASNLESHGQLAQSISTQIQTNND